MESLPKWRLVRSVVVATAGLAPALLLASPVFAAPVAGTNLLTNGNFASGVDTNSTPTGWTTVDLGVETAPYDTSSTNSYDATGQYPPPSGNPDPSDVGLEDYYDVGSSTGVEGYGVSQSASGTVTQADDPQVSYSTTPSSAPKATNSAWAGSAYEVNFTSGAQTYTLVYFNPWTAYQSSFSGAPTNTATTHYIIGPALTTKTWYTQAPRDLSADISSSFSLSTYMVNSVTVANLEDTTADASPYPNMDGYFADVALAEGGSPSQGVPEAPVASALPVSALLVGAAALFVMRRRRRHAAI